MTHTPGPWKYQGHYPKGVDTTRFVISNESLPVAITHAGPRSQVRSRKAQEQDARLIAAAPDLLQAAEAVADGCMACKEPLHHLHSNISDEDNHAAIKAAIAKARGEQS